MLATRRIEPARTYRDVLARRGIMPMTIERTVKSKGDAVIDWHKKAEIVR